MLDKQMGENEPQPYLTSYIKINLRWIIDLNVKAKNIILFEENTGNVFCNLGAGKDFLGHKRHYP